MGFVNLTSIVSRRSVLPGKGFIAGETPGIVTIDGQPGRALVRLYDRQRGVLVASTQSDASNGTYRIEYISLKSNAFMVVGMDLNEIHNAVVQDRISAVLMPEFEE